MNFLKYFQLALEGTMAVENVFAGKDVPGASKLALVLAGIDAAAKTAAGSGIPQVAGVGALIDTGEQVLVPLIGNLVSVFHQFGLFQHKAKPQPMAVVSSPSSARVSPASRHLAAAAAALAS